MISKQNNLEILLQKNSFLRNIFHCVQDGIILTDPDGLITFVNPSATNLIGISKEELLGTKASDIPVAMYNLAREEIVKKNKPFGLAERTLEDQGPQNVLLQRPDGKTIPVLFNIGSAEDGQMVAILTDNSEMLKKQQQMEEYFNFVAHDLRTPLTAIRTSSELLEDDELSMEESTFLIGSCKTAVTQMESMVEAITERIHIESGNFHLNKTEINLLRILSDLVGHYVIDDNSPHIKLDISNSITVNADESLLRRALNNLLSNAAKYAPSNTIITVGAETTENGISISVSDQGAGIDPEDQPYIFDQFFITNVGKHKGGIGLGLYITAKIAEAHSGTTYVSSQKGEGTTFVINLPH